MIHRRRLTRFIVVLLLATLPCLALAGFARETRSGCAMQISGMSDHTASVMAEHCQHAGHVEQLSPATGTVCTSDAHCSMCDDVSLSFAVSDAPPARHALADGVVLLSLDQLLSSTVAGFWRPPRTR